MNPSEQTMTAAVRTADPKVVLGQARQLAHRLEGLLASAAESMPTELERIDVRIAVALAGSLFDQLEALMRVPALPVRRLHPNS